MNSNAVCWFEIYDDDIDRAKAFYQTVFATELTRLDNPTNKPPFPQPEMWAFRWTNNRTARLVPFGKKMEGVAAGGNSSLV